MSSGRNQAATYSEVAAYQQTMGIQTYDTPSDGRTPTGGFYVEWSATGGFTETGWYNEGSQSVNASSPAYSYTDDEIQNELATGSLNTMFTNWVATISLHDRLNFITNVLPDNCVTEDVVS